MRSVTVGTSTSAVRTVSARSDWLMGVSSRFRRASNSSRMRVSTMSGSLRVTTTTRGFLGFGILLPGDFDLPHFRTENPLPRFWKYQGVAKRHHLPFFYQAFRPL